MAFWSYQTTKALTTADGATVTITGAPGAPKLALFWCSDTGNSTAGGRVIWFGATDGTNHICFHGELDDVGATETRASAFSTTYCVWPRYAAGAAGGQYAFNAWTADGVTLTRTNAVTDNITIHVKFYGGADFEATCGVGTLPTTNGTTESVSGLSHTPNALIYVGGNVDHVAAAESAGGEGVLMMGFATGASAEGGVGGWSDHDVASTNSTMRAMDAALWSPRAARVVDFASFEADGFTVNVNGTGTDATNYGYVAITAPQAWAGWTTLQTGTGTWDVTGAGFQPEDGLFLAAPHVTAYATTTDTYHLVIGGTDGTNQGCSVMLDTDAVATDPGYANYTDAVLKGLARDAADTFSVESVVTFDSWLSTGVRLNQVDAAPSAGKVAMLLLGDTAATDVLIQGKQDLAQQWGTQTAARFGGLLSA